MNHLFSLLKSRLSFWLLLPMLILSSLLSGMIFVDLDALLPTEISKNIKALPQPKTTVTLLLLVFAISLCYLILFLTYNRKPNIKDYDLINPPGFLKHSRTGKYYCQPCLQTRHIASELSVVKKDEMFCRNCKEPYPIDASFIITDKILTKAFDDACNELMLKNKNG